MSTAKRTRLLKTLMTTTALGGALIVAAPAFAADECGAPVNGVVTCASGQTYTDISYAGVTSSTTINVQGGVEADSLALNGEGDLAVNAAPGTRFEVVGNLTRGIELAAQTGKASVVADYASASGTDSVAVSAYAAGDVTVDVASVAASGFESRGVIAVSGGGSTSVKVGQIIASGQSVGVSASAYADTVVEFGSITNATTSSDMRGVSASSSQGNVYVRKLTGDSQSGNVTLGGSYSEGVYVAAQNGGAFIDIGNVQIAGGDSIGISVSGKFIGSLSFDNVTMNGNGAHGLYIRSLDGRFDIDGGDIVTTGSSGRGVFLEGNAGEASFRSITTTGNQGYGLIFSQDGLTTPTDPAKLIVGTVSTAGLGSDAVLVQADGDVTVVAGVIQTLGDDASGLIAHDGATIVVEVGTVETAGDNAPGIHVYDTEDVVVTAGSITTGGYLSHALFIEGVGTASLTAETILTTGNLSAGVRVLDTDEVTLDVGSVVTTGEQSHGVTLRAGTVSGRIDSIVTEGAEARGLTVAASDVDLEFGSIETFGNDATGIEATSEDGLVRLRGDSIITHGANARGVELASVMGGVLEIGSVHTYGAGSDGVSASVGENISFAPSASSLLTLDIGQVVTEGEGAFGINLTNGLGEISGHIESIETLGEYSHGLSLGQDDGVTDLTLGSVVTRGQESVGVTVGIGSGEVSILTNALSTYGDYAHGALLSMYGGSADLAFNTVTTDGERALGMALRGFAGEGVLRANSVTTTGEGSFGVALAGEDDMRMTAEVGTVTTSGDGAHAITTSWDGLGNTSEAVTVKAGTLATSGSNANGLYLYSQDLTLDIGRITTTGGGSTGAFLTNYGGDDEITTLRGRIGAIDTSGQEASGLVVQHTGRFDLEVGATHTRGDGSTGITIFAAASSEAGGKLVAGSVLTEGYEAVGVDLYAESGGYDVAVQSIETRGDYSTGLDLRGGETSTIQLGTVRTSGEHADGVYASLYGLDADLTVTADDIRTTGVNAYGLRARAEADVTLNLGYVDATGSESDAVVAESGGTLTLTATRRLGSASGLAADLEGETIDVTLASTAVVEGGAGGLLLASESGSIVRNAGSISSADGFAIEADSGQVTLENSGLITGRIAFTGEDDVVNNSGRFAASLTSNFGGGDDVFNNTGVLSLADPAATGPRTAVFNNLERLNNAGVIDLANGVAGDLFEVSGLINGQAGGRIALDLDMRGATPVADTIAAGGFEGLSEVVLSLQGRAALGDTGVVIARSAMAQTGQEMTVRVAGGGFVGFDLAFDGGEYRVSGNLTPPAFEPTKVASGAQHQWTSGADVVSARFDQMRDVGGRPDGRGDQVWAQVYGGSNDIETKRSFDLLGETIDADLSHEVKSQGVQAGVDRAVPVENGALVFGMLAGAGKTELRFQNGDVTEYDGVGVGAYGHWFSGPLSIGVVAKLDTFKLDYDWAEANLKTRSDGFTVGARVDAAWRIAMGPNWYVEPQASVSWSDTALGRMKARDGAEVVFGDTTSMIGRIGVRAGAEMALDNGLSLKPFAAVHALNEFEGDNASTLILGEEAVGVADRAHGAWGRAVLGASLDAPSGLGGFIQAEGDFGEVEGFTARAGVKFSW